MKLGAAGDFLKIDGDAVAADAGSGVCSWALTAAPVRVWAIPVEANHNKTSPGLTALQNVGIPP